MIECHRDVGAERRLDFDGTLGRDHPAAAIHVALEFDALLVDATKACEREHLEAAGIGQQRAIPCHELVKAAELLDDVLAGTDVQVVGVREDDLRAHGFQIGRR